MLHRLVLGATILAILASLVAVASPTASLLAQTRDDFAVNGGWFFSQANGQGGGGAIGFSVTNSNGIGFWNAFQAYGGVPELGFPISNRFIYKGQVTQAFQKGALQWQGQQGVAQLVNVFDELSVAGFDNWLLANKQVPNIFDWSGDAGLAFPQIVARHEAILDRNPTLQAAYFAATDPIDVNGLPMGYQDFGNVVTVRAQRRAFQLWKVDSPFAAAGQVIVMNGGSIAAEAGLWPAAALNPQPPGDGQQPVNAATPVPTATPAPQQANCNGDERMYFSPSNPVVGQQVFVNVTSNRPSPNVNLNGPWGPTFNSVGQNGGGYLWTWRFTPQNTGRNDYNFTINGVTCTTNFVNVASNVGPTPTPIPTPTPAPPQQVCGGEGYSTTPGGPIPANSAFRIDVRAPKSQRPVTLVGPGSPTNPTSDQGVGSWSFNIAPLPAGAHEYSFTSRGQTCFRFAVVVNSR